MKPMIPKRTRRLRARAAAMHTDPEFEDYGPEPNMKLSHAFLVVLLLHVIAVGGIYAFNSFKASKAPKLVAARATMPADPSNQAGQQGSPGDQGPKQEDPKNQPPSEEKPPLVAKTSDATQVTENTPAQPQPDAAKSETHQGLIARLKVVVLRLSGRSTVASAASATVATAAAQENTNPDAASQPTPASVSPTVSTPGTYVVKSGDTITKIASTLGVTILDLEKANGLTGNSVLQVGENLKVPEKEPTPPAAEPVAGNAQEPPPGGVAAPATAPADTKNMTDYTVVKGDNPYKIAKKFKISTEALMKANNITDPRKIQIGQKLKIPPSTKTPKSAK
jgi:LysM repeat protein